jgi:Ring finger domain
MMGSPMIALFFAIFLMKQVVQAGHLIPAEDVAVSKDPKELEVRRGGANGGKASEKDDSEVTPTLTQTIHNESSVDVVEDGCPKMPLERDTSLEQRLDHEMALVMERGDGGASAAAENCNDGVVVRRDEAVNDEEGDDDDEEEEEEEEDEEDASNGYLQLTATRRVPNCCAVCLSGYEVGEKVVWSPNRKCRHAFHRDCIVDWFVKMPDDGTSSGMSTPCPCCRRDFTDLEAYRREKRIRWSAEYAFNPSFITLR